MTETKSGNPFFGKKSTKAYTNACKEMNTQEAIDRMTELHHSDYKFPAHSRKKIKKAKNW